MKLLSKNLKLSPLSLAIDYIFTWLLIFCFISTIAGSISSFLEIKWGAPVIIISGLLSLSLLWLNKNSIKGFQKPQQTIGLIVVLLTTYIAYRRYSPVIELRQDPAVYMLRANNLINYGFDYKPMDQLKPMVDAGIVKKKELYGYGKIFNGTQLSSDFKLEADFLPASSFIYATFGYFERDNKYYASTLIALLIAFLVFKLTENISCTTSRVALTLTLMSSPLILWFTRAPYSEPFALLVFLALIYYLKADHTFDNLSAKLIPAVICLCIPLIRIDLFFLYILASFYMFINSNKRFAIPFGICAILQLFLVTSTYPIYVNRISNAFNFLSYIPYMLGLVLILAITLKDQLKTLASRLFSNKIVINTLALVCIAIPLLMFWDNSVSSSAHQTANIHGRILRTFNELNFDRLFLAFPPLVLVLGFFNLAFSINHKKFGDISIWIILPVLTISSIYLVDIKNSPQLYWALRRYVPTLIPIIFLSYVFFVERVDIKLSRYLVGAIFLLTLNTTLATNQKKGEMRGLDKTVSYFTKMFDESRDYVVAYDKKLKYPVSSLISHSKFQALPVESDSIEKIIKNTDKSMLYISTERLEDKIREQYFREVKSFPIEYTRKGENYTSLPIDNQSHKYHVYVYILDRA